MNDRHHEITLLLKDLQKTRGILAAILLQTNNKQINLGGAVEQMGLLYEKGIQIKKAEDGIIIMIDPDFDPLNTAKT
jgi:hypothetical protein